MPTQQTLFDEVSAARTHDAQQLAALSNTSGGIAGTLAAAERGETLPAATAGIFLEPIANAVIGSPFGPRTDPLTGVVGIHTGLDLVAVSGTPIRAAGDGVVLIASDQDGYGNCTVIDHGSGLGTLYGHQSAFAVKVGDTVKRGQIIGYVGSTGHSTGPHLHWEVREFGKPLDPVPFMSGT